MNDKKLLLGILALLVSIKFIYMPWVEWIDSTLEDNKRLALLSEKQSKAIDNEESLREVLEQYKTSIENFINDVPSLESEQEINLYWLNLASDFKSQGLKVYNQNVEFITPVSSSIGVVTGTLSISGNASLVMEAIVTLEKKSPYLFIGELKISKPSLQSTSELVAQMKIGHWYSFKEGNT